MSMCFHTPCVMTGVVACCFASAICSAADNGLPPLAVFTKYCGDCHTNGEMEGSLALDQLLAAADWKADRPKWASVWKNLRTQLMPPADQPQPSADEKRALLSWIEDRVFELDPEHPDPGRVTIRRLNRTEYRHTIRDLLGVDFDTENAFPADDTGYGFDTIGDVLSLSPLQVEKYLQAAREITAKAVPTTGPKIPILSAYGDNFVAPDNDKVSAKSLPLSAATEVVRRQTIDHPGPYRFRFAFRITGANGPTAERSVLIVKVDDVEVARRDLSWDSDENLSLTFESPMSQGKHRLVLQMQPQTPPAEGEKVQTFRLRKLDLEGPLDRSYVEYPENYKRIFREGPPPTDPAARAAYARQTLQRLTERAFRRPVDEPTLDRLLAFAATFDVPTDPNGFEKGVAEALTAVLASPRFLFRAEAQPEPDNHTRVAPIDEFALASRLSYFLWSSLPDEELFELARSGKLREQLRPQIDRLLADERAQRFVRNFVGQWLRSRDVETINVDARRILKVSVEESFAIFNGNLRRAMHEETDRMFAHIVAENRSVLDLLTADYAFLNETLALWYGIEGVKGNDMRKVSLPPDSPRGGILSQASFLIVTSNPARTSPVKRGLFILDNLLGTPAPAPPPNVPPLEAVKQGAEKLSMRELMVQHRADPLCASCHARMDPLGLALEEFDALGRWRKDDAGQPIDTAGKLITGESFANVRELSRVIATARRNDFYTCLTEKMLTYALGRGVEYYDAPAIDKLVQLLQSDEGRIRSLIYGIVESAPFQLRRGDDNG